MARTKFPTVISGFHSAEKFLTLARPPARGDENTEENRQLFVGSDTCCSNEAEVKLLISEIRKCGNFDIFFEVNSRQENYAPWILILAKNKNADWRRIMCLSRLRGAVETRPYTFENITAGYKFDGVTLWWD